MPSQPIFREGADFFTREPYRSILLIVEKYNRRYNNGPKPGEIRYCISGGEVGNDSIEAKELCEMLIDEVQQQPVNTLGDRNFSNMLRRLRKWELIISQKGRRYRLKEDFLSLKMASLTAEENLIKKVSGGVVLYMSDAVPNHSWLDSYNLMIPEDMSTSMNDMWNEVIKKELYSIIEESYNLDIPLQFIIRETLLRLPFNDRLLGPYHDDDAYLESAYPSLPPPYTKIEDEGEVSFDDVIRKEEGDPKYTEREEEVVSLYSFISDNIKELHELKTRMRREKIDGTRRHNAYPVLPPPFTIFDEGIVPLNRLELKALKDKRLNKYYEMHLNIDVEKLQSNKYVKNAIKQIETRIMRLVNLVHNTWAVAIATR